jgi:serine/threonine-protein kinase
VCGKQLAAGKPLLCPSCLAVAGEQHQFVEGYTIIRKLGSGATGVVWMAVREADGGLVALKTLTPTGPHAEEDVKRFLREATTLQDLDHPNIVGFRDLGECDGQLYFAMEYVRGRNVDEWLKKHGTPTVRHAVGIILHALRGLEYAHKRGYVHRDVKPANPS